MWEMARRPQWIAALVLALALAAAFAFLGQWQLERSVSGVEAPIAEVEAVKPLTELSEPGVQVTGQSVDHMVSVTGFVQANGYQVINDRLSEGEPGVWVVAPVSLVNDTGLVTDEMVVIALGWAPDAPAADEFIAQAVVASGGVTEPTEFVGRLMPSEAPQTQEDVVDVGNPSSLSVAELINRWQIPGEIGVYDGFVALQQAPDPLVTIDAPAPTTEKEINWLNIFYAIEWVVFAGFAVFLWWRLMADSYQREQELKAAAGGDAE